MLQIACLVVGGIATENGAFRSVGKVVVVLLHLAIASTTQQCAFVWIVWLWRRSIRIRATVS